MTAPAIVLTAGLSESSQRIKVRRKTGDVHAGRLRTLVFDSESAAAPSRGQLLNDTALSIDDVAFDAGRKAYSDLVDAARSASEADWDGYGGLPVSTAILEQARRVLSNVLRHAPAPTRVLAEGEGRLSFVWRKHGEYTLALSIGADSTITYAGVFAGESTRGSATIEDSTPDILAAVLRRVEAGT